MTKNNVGREVKRLRGDDTQQKFAYGKGVVRETVSKWETGRSPVPPDISRVLMKEYDDPRFAMTVRHEYTGTGPRWLDGPNVDLHRASVKEKTLEEMQEAVHVIQSISFANPLRCNSSVKLEEAAVQIGQAIIAMEHLIAVMCLEGNLSYTNVWERIHELLKKAGYIGGVQ